MTALHFLLGHCQVTVLTDLNFMDLRFGRSYHGAHTADHPELEFLSTIFLWPAYRRKREECVGGPTNRSGRSGSITHITDASVDGIVCVRSPKFCEDLPKCCFTCVEQT